ncbi:NDxxF motif lipoprotein [Staphylococcus sp. Marseille-Q5304]|uniref:NDxxF motif lipoprotein n=1 Tax=Staphylococcus sp. Marseille-Q5304 TaxID=2942200 RepID=UPI0020742435|nr:NDxxF motif lipoprotein [Staphylococcus sp. Marseille-Q5304]
MMRKYYIFGLFFLLIFATGCSNTHYNVGETDNKDLEKKEAPQDIFNYKTTNTQLSEQEIKKAIKLYLNKDEDLSKAKEYYQDKVDSEEKLSMDESKKIKKLNELTRKNDNNFYNYIRKNRLPEDYKNIHIK